MALVLGRSVPPNSPYLYGGGLPRRVVVRPTVPTYPTYTAGPRGQRVPFDPTIFKTTTPTRPPTTVRPPTRNPTGMPSLLDLYNQLVGTIETPAQQEARVQREVDAQIAAQQKMIADEYARQRADALTAMQAMSAAGAAAAAMSKGLIGSVGGEYNAAAQEIAGLAGGLTSAFNAGTAADVKAANKALGNVSAPALTEGGLTGYGGGLQAGVENFRGGTIPEQLISTLGDAATFGLAGQTAAGNLRATQEATAAFMSLTHDINSAETKAVQELAAGRPALAHQYLQDAQTARDKQIALAQGLVAQSQAGTTTKPITQRVGNTVFQWNPTTGKWVKVIAGAPNATKLTFQTVKGRRVAIDPVSGKVVADYGPAGGPQKKTNLQIKQVVGPDGKIHDVAINPTTGQVVVDYGPRPAKAPPAKKPPSAATVAKATTLIKEWVYGYVDVPTSSAPNAPKKRIPAYQAPGFNPQDPATWGTGYTGYVQALSQLTRMGFNRDTARNMLNEYYERGDMGRPIFSSEEQTWLKTQFAKAEYERMLVAIRRAIDRGSHDQAVAWINSMLRGVAFHPGYTGGTGTPSG